MKKIKQQSSKKQIPIKRIDYSTLTEDEKELLQIIKKIKKDHSKK